VDQPAANALMRQGEPLRVRGWAANFDDPALTGIAEVTLYSGAVANDKLLARAEIGRPRTDVARHFGDGRLNDTGFEASVPTAGLAPGSHTLVIVVRTRENGSWQRSVPFSVMGNVRRAPGEFVYATHVANPREDARLAAAAGFTHMSAYVSWAGVEPRKDHFLFETTNEWGQTTANDLTNVVEAAEEAGLKLILRVDDPPGWAGGKPNRLDPRDVNDYVSAVVRHARGTVEYIEILNEPNLPLEWGGPPDPARYAQLLRAAYAGAKRADPSVKVVSAAVSQRTGGLGGTMEDVDWLDGFYRAGAKDAFDLLGLHAYPGSYAPAAGADCIPLCFRNIELYRAVMERHGDGGKKALITELGLLEQTPTDLGAHDWMELPAAQRAEHLVQTLQLAASYPWLVGVATFNLDYATTPWVAPNTAPYWFSLLNPDRSPRAAYRAFKEARANGQLP
jgi:hypothetical protein